MAAVMWMIRRLTLPVAIWLVVASATQTLAPGDGVMGGESAGEEAPTIALVGDDSSTIALSEPGETSIECVTVVRGGAPEPAVVGMYLAPAGLRGTGLDRFIDLTIEVGQLGEGGCEDFTGTVAYSGSLAGFATAHPDTASAVGKWATDQPGERVTYRISMVLSDDTGAQGRSASVAFTWGIIEGRGTDGIAA